MTTAPSNSKPVLVAVTGAWHQPSHFDLLKPELAAVGFGHVEVISCRSAGQNVAGITQEDDAAHQRSVLTWLVDAGKTVVLLLHSYAGFPGGAALRGLSLRDRAARQERGGVLGVIYLTSFIGQSGEDLGVHEQSSSKEVHGFVKNRPRPGLTELVDPFPRFYGPDTPPDMADTVISQLVPHSMDSSFGVVPKQGFAAPGYDGRRAYIFCELDQAVPLAAQQAMVQANGGDDKWITRMMKGAGHSPFVARPKELAEVVAGIVDEFEKA